MRATIVLTMLLATSCRYGLGGPVDVYGYGSKWQYFGEPAPRCADEVHAAAMALAPCPKGVPRYGHITWHPTHFACGSAGEVWGCSDSQAYWVAVWAAVAPNAADSAMPEEIAHWVWAKCELPVTEWWFDPAVGIKIFGGPRPTPGAIFQRDPAFQAWYTKVAETARKVCP